MTMRVLHGAGPGDIDSYGTDRLRAEFLIERLFRRGGIEFVYTHVDRMIVGGAVPTRDALSFGDGADVGTPLFFTAREMGIANLGGSGSATVDGRTFALANRDILYVGRGAREVTLASDDADAPARFYMNSVPAGADIPHRLITRAEAKPLDLGDERRANKRTLRMYIHPEVAPSCLLLMGITDLAPGSVWNTMPPHLHDRRSEVYFYFDLESPPGDQSAQRVLHFMGEPHETRSLVLGNEEAVISPPWSIHMGSGTSSYSFIWAMGGENLDYTDMKVLDICQLQ
jgi:4-deoxy-L-threo-5-hexosulose-uronate ketol-isomerase